MSKITYLSNGEQIYDPNNWWEDNWPWIAMILIAMGLTGLAVILGIMIGLGIRW